jgi:type I restriction enzyme S subunit
LFQLLQSLEVSNNLPKGWTITELENCIDILDGQRVPVNSQEREKRKGNIPYYGATGQIGWIDDFLFDEELLLLGEDGAPFFDPRKNKAYIIRGKSWVNNHAHVLRAKDWIASNPYLCYYLNNFRYDGYVSGTTRPKLNQAPMRRIPVRLAPLNEQKRIVSKIEELFTKLDAGIEALKKARIQLKRYRQSVLKAAFEGKLTEGWREKRAADVESDAIRLDRFLSERVNPSTEELGETFYELPRTWRWAKIGTVCKELIGGGTPSRTRPDYFGGRIVWLTPTEIDKERIRVIQDSKEKISELGFKNSSTRMIPEGSVLLSSRATIGSVAIAGRELTTNQGFASFVCTEVLHNFYLAYWLWANKEMLQKKAKGTTFKEISKATLREVSLPIPPYCEQEEIARQLDTVFTYCEQTTNAVKGNLDASAVLKQSILDRAFEGKLVPQDPSDEPASVLLERIRRMKATNGAIPLENS